MVFPSNFRMPEVKMFNNTETPINIRPSYISWGLVINSSPATKGCIIIVVFCAITRGSSLHLVRKSLDKFHHQLSSDGVWIPQIVLQHPKKGWRPRATRNKVAEEWDVIDFIARWRSSHLFVPTKVTAWVGEHVPNNFSHDLMAQSFECFDDLFTRAHNMEIRLDKCKKSVKKSARSTLSITAVVVSKEITTFALGSSSSMKAVSQNPERQEMLPLKSLNLVPILI